MAVGPPLLSRNRFVSVRRRRWGRRLSVDQPIETRPMFYIVLSAVVVLIGTYTAPPERFGCVDYGAGYPMLSHGQPLGEPAPLLVVADHQLRVDGYRVESADGLRTHFATLRRNWEEVHPEDSFPGEVVLLAEPDTDYRHVREALEVAAEAGFPHVSFLGLDSAPSVYGALSNVGSRSTVSPHTQR